VYRPQLSFQMHVLTDLIYIFTLVSISLSPLLHQQPASNAHAREQTLPSNEQEVVQELSSNAAEGVFTTLLNPDGMPFLLQVHLSESSSDGAIASVCA
jgi:hypothetical protein